MRQIDRRDIFRLIEEERERQDMLHPMPRQKKSDDKDIQAVTTMLMNSDFLAVLVEEIGEIGSALQGDGDLKKEIIHAASVAVRWLEHIK